MSLLSVHVAVAKVTKYATSESGDTLEMIERPHGGLSLVLVDGQRSGRGAKTISSIVARKAISLLGDGVRDGAAARAAHDYLRTLRGGKVSATLNILSIDMQTETIVISRNSHCPVIVLSQGQLTILDEPAEPVGIYAGTKPVVTELPIAPQTWVAVFTDGVLHAGQRYGRSVNVPALLQSLVVNYTTVANHTVEAQLTTNCIVAPGSFQSIADTILAEAVACDQGRPEDDISVLLVAVLPGASDENETDCQVRRMSVVFPIHIKKAI